MKIGLLAYHSACNFGATLQLLSTYRYLKNHGHTPIVINWVPEDLEAFYAENTSAAQQQQQFSTRKQLWDETPLCRTDQEVAHTIGQQGIEAVIIGSDAVAQHHPLLERVVFPCKRIVVVDHYTSDRMFPNAFWATWRDLLRRDVPVAVISASCQDSMYRLIPPATRKEMGRRAQRHDYLSVRDTWTADMFRHLTHGKRLPKVTPDPVFAFNQNAGDMVPTKEQTLSKFGLPENYLLLSFYLFNDKSTSPDAWCSEMEAVARKDGKTCVMLPFSSGESQGTLSHTIRLPLSPIDWYALIRHSCGYIGNNMHPIIVALHNAVPFYSFDTFGTFHLNRLVSSDTSSKIKHLLTNAGLPQYRISCISRHFHMPSPQEVYQKVASFDRKVARRFADDCLTRYNDMMEEALKAITRR